ncbi:MAG: sigma-54 dependent transcriptional regulator [Candidatus Aminicenantes bacterium]|nr:sigma-54 dependent transcriptional regulator [Candidatus Aminicenantes bacterium]
MRNGNGILAGTSESFARILALIDKVRDLDAPILIVGESGTGKELIAREIHGRGGRADKPFVAVNCSAIPEHLLESELFGHVRGAFTGAMRDKPGLIEEAGGGTFFLDEIGDLSPALQAKLLRVLQERELRRVGETRTRRVEARFLSATNRDLEKEIARGRFREDLYYRLKIIVIEVPPLRERRPDLLFLLDRFAERYALEMGRPKVGFAPRTVDLLFQYAWPGNVRELQNEVQRAVILCGDDGIVRPEHLSPKLDPRQETGSAAPASTYAEAKSEFVRRFLRQALERCDFNKARTAERVGLSRQGLFKLIKRHGVAEAEAQADGKP